MQRLNQAFIDSQPEDDVEYAGQDGEVEDGSTDKGNKFWVIYYIKSLPCFESLVG